MEDAIESRKQTHTYRVDMRRCVKHYVEYQGVVEMEALTEEDAQERAEGMMERKEIEWHEVGTYDRELIDEDVVEVELADDDDFEEEEGGDGEDLDDIDE